MRYPALQVQISTKQSKSKVSNTSHNVTQYKRTIACIDAGKVVCTSKQFKQLMKRLPQFDHSSDSRGDTDEELEREFVAGNSCIHCLYSSKTIVDGWIIDTGASDHMTPHENTIVSPLLL